MALLVLNELTKRCAAILSAGETIQNRFLPLVVLRLGQGKKTIPSSLVPPNPVVPYIVPLTMMPDWGNAPLPLPLVPKLESKRNLRVWFGRSCISYTEPVAFALLVAP
jgi:hypothetical protein